MKYTTKSGKKLSNLGIGTYGIGGRAHRFVGEIDNTSDKEYIDALIFQLQSGLNFTEISVALAGGKSAHLFSKAFVESRIKREDLFLTHSLYPKDILTIDDIQKDVDSIHKIFNTEYFDSTLITLSLLKKFDSKLIINNLHNLIDEGKTRFISLSNSNRDTIRLFKNEFQDKFFAHEAHLSFEIRENQDEGILELCKNLGVRNNIWRPLRENKTANYNWNLLVELSKKYKKTQNQIILNWMINNEYYPMVFSKNIQHIKENIDAMNFNMEVVDIERLNNYRIPNYKKPSVDWDKTGNGVSIAALPDIFDENYLQ